MYCASCGKQQPTSAVFCPYCGSKHAEEVRETLSSPTPQGQTPGLVVDAATTDIPTGDIDPIFLYEGRKWEFRHKDMTNPPPPWTQGDLDLIITEDYVIFQADKIGLTFGQTLKGIAGIAGVVVAGAVPVLGIAAGAAALGADKLKTGKRKMAGYGSKGQFKREAILQSFRQGEALWANRIECEVNALRSRHFLDVYHYLTISGAFHHITGRCCYLAFNDVSTIYGADLKKDIVNKGGVELTRDEKCQSREQAIASMSDYPYPPTAAH